MTRHRFLLAKLYIDTLASETTPKGIRRALAEWEKIARDSKSSGKHSTPLLDHAYEVVLQRIEHQKLQHRDLARKVLSWVIYAKRNLTPLELQHAVAIEIGMPEFDQENIADIGLSVSVCGGLVIIDQESHVIRLVHYTAQEYLERTWDDRFPESEFAVAKACISYLSLKAFNSGACPSQVMFHQRLNSYPLYQYAAHHWGHHVKGTWLETDPSVWNLLQSKELMAAYSQGIIFASDEEKIFRSVCGMTSLHVAAFFGFSTLMRTLLEQKPELDCKDNVYTMTPLMWAAVHSSRGVAKRLIAAGADIESISAPGLYDYRTALSLAIESGKEEIVKLFFDHGAKMNLETDFLVDAIESAARQGNAGVMGVLLNIEPGIVHVRKIMRGWAMRGQEEVLKLFIDRGFGEWTLVDAISYAAQAGHEKLVNTWLNGCVGREESARWGMKSPLSFVGLEMRSPLSCAAESGYENIVRLLLHHGADPRVDDSHTSPIALAARNGHEKVVKLLLDCKDIVKGNSDILLIAIKGGNEEIVKLLLDHGASLGSSKAPVYAVRSPYDSDESNTDERFQLVTLSTSDTFIRARAPVIRTHWDKRPLTCAIYLGLPRILKLLIDRGADIEMMNGLGQSPLAIACGLGQEEMVILLLSKGANVDRKTFQELTPLMIAAELGNVDIVRALLKHRAKVETRGGHGLTALTAAIRGGHENVVELLLQNQASVTRRGFQEKTPLQLALDQGNLKIVQLIRDILTQAPSNVEEEISELEFEPWEEAYFVLKSKFELWDKCVHDAKGPQDADHFREPTRSTEQISSEGEEETSEAEDKPWEET